MKIAKLIIATAAALALAGPALAFTDCTNTVANVYTGDSGAVQIGVTVGPSAYLYSTDPNLKTILVTGIAALLTGKTVVMRFAASGVSCTTTALRSDLNGLYVNH